MGNDLNIRIGSAPSLTMSASTRYGSLVPVNSRVLRQRDSRKSTKVAWQGASRELQESGVLAK
jgi:hypothetical protein